MIMINLIPPERFILREVRHRIRLWVCRLGVSVVFLGAVYIGFLHLVSSRDAEVQQLTAKCALLQERFLRAESLVGERDRLARRREAIWSIRDDHPAGWYLEILGKCLTPDGYLTFLELDRCTPQESDQRQSRDAEPSAANLRIRGRASGHEQVGEILRNLAVSSAFSDVGLITVKEPRRSPGAREVQFELRCALAEEVAPGQ